ncbi:hypothetical protein PRUPE_2G002000 [Prunus persica]|uniref:Uncharacterized protein n=1 Tax=Prunus persica TaxID=3760 RepID=A0A251Q8L8_PRUPE|nr:hypothetical protein PRUPE_2G002000 [Prunus persica]
MTNSILENFHFLKATFLMFSRALEFSPAFPPSPLSPDHVTATPPPPLFFFFLPNAATHTPPSPPMATQIASLLLLNASSPAAASPSTTPSLWLLTTDAGPGPLKVTVLISISPCPVGWLKWDLGPHDILGTLVDDFSDYSGAFEVEDVVIGKVEIGFGVLFVGERSLLSLSWKEGH